MSSTLSPRQVESVEQWLDDQPRSQKENDSIILPGRSQYTKENKEPPRAHFTPTNDRNFPRDLGSDHDNYVDPVECFLRVCSACLASAALAVGAVTYVLIHRNRLPSGGSVLDNRLSWVIAVPVSAVAVVWQLTRLSLLAWTSTASSFVLLSVDIVLEALLAVGSVICAILAGFQAARHTTYNSKHHDGVAYQDVGPEISLAALLGLLSITSFGILALSFVEANRRRRSRSSNRSTSSSVIEIIS
ncbi:hypothetical protein SEUCBS139899_009086 [Sporothrix eucalyptigena]